MKSANFIQLIIAAIISLAGMGLLFYGAQVDPAGEIDESILVAFGEAATFAGSIIGIDYRYKYVKHDSTTNQNKTAAGKLGCEVLCFMSDPDVAEIAKKRGCTRAVASMEKASRLGGPLVFAIGNAPTALLRIREMMDEGTLTPELVIGVPVGFVNVVESKEAIMETDVPYIVAKGRKGGSNVAAAIVNALMYQLTR